MFLMLMKQFYSIEQARLFVHAVVISNSSQGRLGRQDTGRADRPNEG